MFTFQVLRQKTVLQKSPIEVHSPDVLVLCSNRLYYLILTHAVWSDNESVTRFNPEGISPQIEMW